MCLVGRKTFSTFLINLQRLITCTLSPIIIIMSWSQTLYTFLSVPKSIFLTIFGNISTLMISLLNSEELITLVACSCDEIIFFLTSHTWFEIFWWEGFIRWTLLNWETLRLKLFKFFINWFIITILGNPIFTCIVIWFFENLFALIRVWKIFLLIFAVSTYFGSDIKNLARRTSCACFAIWWERLIGKTLLSCNFVIFQLINFVFVLLLSYRTPDKWIFRGI